MAGGLFGEFNQSIPLCVTDPTLILPGTFLNSFSCVVYDGTSTPNGVPGKNSQKKVNFFPKILRN